MLAGGIEREQWHEWVNCKILSIKPIKTQAADIPRFVNALWFSAPNVEIIEIKGTLLTLN